MEAVRDTLPYRKVSKRDLHGKQILKANTSCRIAQDRSSMDWSHRRVQRYSYRKRLVPDLQEMLIHHVWTSKSHQDNSGFECIYIIAKLYTINPRLVFRNCKCSISQVMRKRQSHEIIPLKCDYRSNSTVGLRPSLCHRSVLLLSNHLRFRNLRSVYT